MAVAAANDLDALDRSAFVAAVAPLFEGAPGLLSRLAVARPFGHADALFDAALEIAARLPAARMGGAIEVRPLVER